ncbi:MAG: alpha-E domain-containing protein [Myxococcales bacterium]|nr:alpha-E domain-containing protein [Myxococcales bacterium]
MITRVADHCFWLGRYLERTESTARHLQVTGTIALDAELPQGRVWAPLVIVSGQEADFVERFGKASMGEPEIVQRYLALDLDNPVSLARSIAAARENARSIREVVSLEVWQTINELYVYFQSEEAKTAYAEQRDAFFGRVQRSIQLGVGLVGSTMLHDTPLDFISLGILLERVSQTARLLDVEHHAFSAASAAHPVLETALWLSLLRASSGFEAFMKRNRGIVTGASVAAFLVKEPRFPRSVLHSTAHARRRLEAIIGHGTAGGPEAPGEPALRRLVALERWLEALPATALEGAEVHRTLTHVVEEAHAVCVATGSELLGYGAASQ